jgi:hypothetical protein
LKSWCLAAASLSKLCLWHNKRTREMYRVAMFHQTMAHRITSKSMQQRTGIFDLQHNVASRTLLWAGHVARIPKSRLPKKPMLSWMQELFLSGGQKMNFGRSLSRHLQHFGLALAFAEWATIAQGHAKWHRLATKPLFAIGKPFLRQPVGDTRATPEGQRVAIAYRAAKIKERRVVFAANVNRKPTIPTPTPAHQQKSMILHPLRGTCPLRPEAARVIHSEISEASHTTPAGGRHTHKENWRRQTARGPQKDTRELRLAVFACICLNVLMDVLPALFAVDIAPRTQLQQGGCEGGRELNPGRQVATHPTPPPGRPPCCWGGRPPSQKDRRAAGGVDPPPGKSAVPLGVRARLWLKFSPPRGVNTKHSMALQTAPPLLFLAGL